MNRIELLRQGGLSLSRIMKIIDERGRRNVEAEAQKVFAALAEALDDHHHAPRCPANHYHGARCPANHPVLGRVS